MKGPEGYGNSSAKAAGASREESGRSHRESRMVQAYSRYMDVFKYSYSPLHSGIRLYNDPLSLARITLRERDFLVINLLGGGAMIRLYGAPNRCHIFI